jgi:hypothetical protein
MSKSGSLEKNFSQSASRIFDLLGSGPAEEE